MKVRIDVTNEEAARRSANRAHLSVHLVKHPEGEWPELILTGRRRHLEPWLTRAGYAQGDYTVVSEQRNRIIG